jgi:dTDP-4-amino-4,6-dideoxygalactose transaminase
MILCSNPRAQFESYKSDIENAINQVLSGNQYILGENVGAFEREFADYVGVDHAIGVASGTDALCLALRALDVGPGTEVIAPSHTAVATVAAIGMAGAIPVLVDVEPGYYTLSPKAVELAVTDRTRAVIAVHLYGKPADMDAILEIARRHELKIIEDCAQAHGALYAGQRVGSIGAIGCFSFYPTKNLGALGDGGMVVTKSKALSSRVCRLAQYGWDENRISREAGWNSRLDEIQAAVLCVKLPHLDRDNERRCAVAQKYNEGLNGLPIALPEICDNENNVYHLYVIESDRRNDLVDYLKTRKIYAGIHYPVPVHKMPAYADCLPIGANLSQTEALADRVLSLPMYPELTENEQDEVISTIRGFCCL